MGPHWTFESTVLTSNLTRNLIGPPDPNAGPHQTLNSRYSPHTSPRTSPDSNTGPHRTSPDHGNHGTHLTPYRALHRTPYWNTPDFTGPHRTSLDLGTHGTQLLSHRALHRNLTGPPHWTATDLTRPQRTAPDLETHGTHLIESVLSHSESRVSEITHCTPPNFAITSQGDKLRH